MSTNRKDTLRQLLNPGNVVTPGIETGDTQHVAAHTERAGAGAVRVMGLSLTRLTEEAETGRALRAQLTSGVTVVELEPEIIDPSPVSDRLSMPDDEAFSALVKSIELHGQQVPILVRPHPENSGRYQIAYGHRRLRAAKRLRFKVRAVVRELSNTELVIAQGKENSERRNLSFIERALFARHLEDAGFDRSIVMTALSVDKPEAARLLTVARAIPDELVIAIGPAPKAGRPRWLALAQLLESAESRSVAESFLGDPAFNSADTDSRFRKLFSVICASAAVKKGGSTWRDPSGRPVVRIEHARGRTRFIFDEKLAPKFGAFVCDKLAQLYADFSARAPDS